MLHAKLTPLIILWHLYNIFSSECVQNCMPHAEHPWIKEGGEASDKPIDSAVLSRMKQFRAMNKLKKLALKVILKMLHSFIVFLME